MSTRRSTRAASQASRSATPAAGANDFQSTPAPRRTARRAGNAPLPAVATRRSTAYGDNTIPQPARMSGLQDGNEVTDVLNNLLGSNQESSSPLIRLPSNPTPAQSPVAPKGSASRSRSQTPAAATSTQKSFIDESNIFGDAGVDSSVVTSDDAPFLPDIAQERLNADLLYMEILAKQRLDAAHVARGNRFPTLQANVRSFMRKARSWSNGAGPVVFWVLLSILGLGFLACFCEAMLRGGQSSLGAFTSGNQSHILPKELYSINQRLKTLEHEVKAIKSQFSEFDPRSIDKLNQLLPDQLMVKKDKHGRLLLSDDFWHALLDKLESEDTSGEDASPGLSAKERKGSNWSKWFRGNKAKVETYTLDHLSSVFPKLLLENHIVSKEDTIKYIQDTWIEHKDGISKDMDALKKKLDIASDNIEKAKHGSAHSQKELAAAVEETIKKLIPKAQLEALSQSKLEITNPGLAQVNHLSKGTGAIVDVSLSSPTYIFPEHNVWWWTRVKNHIQHNDIPVPNAPETALTPWQEYGDCWCAPSPDHEGPPTSLTVIMGHAIFATQVVVEHILPSGSIEPGSTPKDMELLAFISNPDLLRRVQELSNGLFPESDNVDIPHGFVRVAEWTYDAHSKHFVQSFGVQLDMKAIGVQTKKVMVRAKNNWGRGNVPYTCFYRVRVHGETSNPSAHLGGADI